MKEYKVVPCQGKVVANNDIDASKQISALVEIIVQETYAGWQLVSTMPVIVSSSKKSDGKEHPYNALIFAREVIGDDPA